MTTRSRDQPYYSIRQIRSCIQDNKYLIDHIAIEGAKRSFGWRTSDIVVAVYALTRNHYKKSKSHFENPQIYVDHYIADKLHGEKNVYVHLHIEDDCLYIGSVKSNTPRGSNS